MKDYKKIILNKLLDSYEKSKLYTGENKVSVKIAVNIKAQFKEYTDETNIKSFQEINEACISLSDEELVYLEWEKYQEGNIVRRIILKTENVGLAYKLIGRKEKKAFMEETLNLFKGELNKYSGISQDKLWLITFFNDMIELISQNKSVKKYIDIENYQETENIIKALEAMIAVDHEIYKREFSIMLYNDSKVFEKLENKIIRIIRDYEDKAETEEYYYDADILGEYNILNNPGYVYMKGKGLITIGKQEIDLGLIGGEIAFSSSSLNNITKIAINNAHVITIENLTSFHSFIKDDMLIIYLGGYHNGIRREFLKLIYAQNPGTEFYHFGDIDAGGLKILNHLRNKTGIPFKPYMMDKETLLKFINFSKPLSENDQNTLAAMLQFDNYKEFTEVIKTMLKYNKKLEQESINCRINLQEE